jgi:hypothetical protein
VAADVVHGPDVTGLGARDDDRVLTDFDELVVTGGGSATILITRSSMLLIVVYLLSRNQMSYSKQGQGLVLLNYVMFKPRILPHKY